MTSVDGTFEGASAEPRMRVRQGTGGPARAPGSSGALVRLLVGSLIALVGVLLAPAAALAIDEFPLPNANSGPASITTGPDGALWFTEEIGQRIGRITTSGVVTEFPVPSSPSPPGPAEIVSAAGALWFTELTNAKIGRLGTDGTLTEYGPTGAGPDGLTLGPDGKLWFTEYNANRIARIDPNNPGTPGSPNFDVFPIPLTASGPGDITGGPDGKLWFTMFAANKVGSIPTNATPGDGGSILTYDVPTPTSDLSDITSSGGALWFTENGGNKIGRISTTGVVTNEFDVPTASSGPSAIALGPDGALWFTQSNANKVGRMTASGSFTEFPTPSSAVEGPDGITVGPDNAMWFTEKGANKIGRIEAPLPPPLGCPPICPLPPPQATLSLRSLRIAPNAFKAAPRGPSASAKVGARVSYRLALAASTRFTIERETAGRKKGRRCVPQTKRNRRAKRCKRYVALRGSLTHVGKAGSNSFKFSGRLRSKKLRPGKYRLVAVASAGGKKTKPARAGFKIVRR